MAVIRKKLQVTTDAFIRELFKNKIEPDEKILWHGGSNYCYSFDGKVNYRLLLVLIRVVLGMSLVVLCIQALLDNDRGFPSGLMMAAFTILLVIIFAEEILGVTYPRYFVVTDRQIGLCKRSFFARNDYRCIPYEDIRDVFVKEEINDKLIFLDMRDNDDPSLQISGLNFTETDMAYEKISAALEKNKKENKRPYDKSDW